MTDLVKIDNPTDREVKWQRYYNEIWKKPPNKNLPSASEKFWMHPNGKTMNDMLNEKGVYKNATKAAGETAVNKLAAFGLNHLVAAEEIGRASVGGIVSQTGRRGAIVVAEETARLAATKGANVAITGVQTIGSLPVGLTATIGEIIGDSISSKAGINNHHAKNAIGVGGSIAGGATAGAVVGGPIGAAAGVVLGVGSWAFGQSIKSILRNIGKHTTDKLCFIEVIGDQEICVGTYAGDDTLYWKTYWTECKKSNSKWGMSAGQPPTARFQLCIWHGGHVIHHFDDVNCRDLFGIVKIGKKFRVLHCRGEYHPVDAGKTFLFEKWNS